jgi:hypothetical protein
MLDCGEVLYDPKFRFRDGELGTKLCVVLSDHSIDEDEFLFVITTSQTKAFPEVTECGCALPEFACHLFAGDPKDRSKFDTQTFVQLDYFYSKSGDYFTTKMNSQGMESKFKLSKTQTKELLECALQSEDLTGYDSEILQKSLDLVNQ